MEAKTLLIIAIVLAALGGAVFLLASQTHTEESLATAPAVRPAGEAPQPAAPEALEGGRTPPLVASTPGLSSEQTASSDLSGTPSSPRRQVVATYFHNTTRCVTCRTIEKLAKETLESAFSAELASGELAWRALNMESKENEHYADEYALTSPSLVLAEVDEGGGARFKVLNETWTLVHRPNRFAEYVTAEVRAFLGGSGD